VGVAVRLLRHQQATSPYRPPPPWCCTAAPSPTAELSVRSITVPQGSTVSGCGRPSSRVCSGCISTSDVSDAGSIPSWILFSWSGSLYWVYPRMPQTVTAHQLSLQLLEASNVQPAAVAGAPCMVLPALELEG